jgi:hypothetical protein
VHSRQGARSARARCLLRAKAKGVARNKPGYTHTAGIRTRCSWELFRRPWTWVGLSAVGSCSVTARAPTFVGVRLFPAVVTRALWRKYGTVVFAWLGSHVERNEAYISAYQCRAGNERRLGIHGRVGCSRSQYIGILPGSGSRARMLRRGRAVFLFWMGGGVGGGGGAHHRC